ncbi:6-phosphogluconate dehydrogenase [Tenacibaculum finnmarkense genomovar finnmarkense]|uniref:6-phosphogluconate dehydrogenase n=1 Tax=Tenacibaculum finnmarkense genomovar finnmarkense TaxID=1458503 RepID=A0AAP1RFQ9_9FLAO|nr:6-phosphogluconate dehydrogenase [Tenacibaculum finnmarkense]MBE7652842.1 6-phosphogluconate dehydrogenase [Tenacibaculum finnmarkense genomovar finnmarkense]MBE7659880.1 6-phosphogluconate dehydrogenase [Tenacibaculum finnmarkense genomovar finnmarkense]MBE7692484.1 6-phosphogluconate dehydrogenase [Tenacibaculum finnmarkense genomovar finnmarkense]MBE7695112.1 6-phosphogluconate dehydrogenase [Tenacibaculum finnmarkense genomovar finnmarkense]MCD8402646.1 6-phosphogluconate dehydrogenase 
MKKIVALIILIITLISFSYYAFIYYVPYSKGVRSGELIKISYKGVVVKSWEGEISQGISGAQIFSFSVQDNEKKVIADLQKFQGRYVKITYKELYRTFSWLGDSKYFVTKVEQENSPHFRSLEETPEIKKQE